MGYSADHIASTRKRILRCAGRLFRELGYAGVGIDSIMKEAGLTRGGFYAHFASKADLFKCAVSVPFDFANQLRALRDSEAAQVPDRTHFAMQQYLSNETREHIGKACTMASSAVDCARSGNATRIEFGQGVLAVVEEIQNTRAADGLDDDIDRAIVDLSACVGALVLARASDDETAETLLSAARSALTSAKERK